MFFFASIQEKHNFIESKSLKLKVVFKNSKIPANLAGTLVQFTAF